METGFRVASLSGSCLTAFFPDHRLVKCYPMFVTEKQQVAGNLTYLSP